jgi:protein O-mannosyl-transferase
MSAKSPVALGLVRSGRLALLGGVPMLLAGLVYLNALENPFVWDDFRTVAANASLEDLWNLRAVLTHDATRPLVNLSYAVDRAVWGPSTFGFHLTSVLLHVLNVLLLFQLTRRLVDEGQGPAGTIRADVAAFAAASLFAVHPMMTEAVGYISARADVLCTALLLLAFLSMRAWVRGAGWHWLAGSITLWVMALATKEIAVVFPLFLLAFRYFMSADQPELHRLRLARATAAVLVATLGAAVLRIAVLLLLENPGLGTIHWPLVLVEIDVVREYLVLMFRPGGQSIMHSVSAINSVFAPRALLSIALVTGLVVVAIRSRQAHGAIGFGLIWFLASLAPPAALVVLDLGHPMAEHRMYLASCGLFLNAGMAYAWLVARAPSLNWRLRLLRPIALSVGIFTLAGTTIVRNAVWTDPRMLWFDAVQKAPDMWLPQLVLGEALHDAGGHARAVLAYREAIRLRPDHPDTYVKLGLCLAELRRLDEAKAVFEQLRRLAPRSAAAATGLGSIAVLSGQLDDAQTLFNEALMLEPQNTSAQQSLAMLHTLIERGPAGVVREPPLRAGQQR